MYIRHSEIKSVEFSRAGAGRTFDITLNKLNEDQLVTFLQIDRDEHKIMIEYFTQSNIKIKTVDNETKRGADRKDAETKQGDDQEMDYDDEEDGSDNESFNEEENK